MNDNFFCKRLHDLPHPPTHFVDTAMSVDRPVENLGGYALHHLKDWKGLSYTAPRQIRGTIGPVFETWVKQNIVDDYNDTGLAWFDGNTEMPSTGAHTDYTRDYVLIYSVDQGGPDATLAFWQEQDQPLIRPRGTEGVTTRNLELIQEFSNLERTWYLVNARILHSVENVSKPRIGFQISFDTTLPPNIVRLFD